jgi:putative ubiquitin-RnfH superfamily antitoxin RatB of RatAB toxin-antitoxin module
MTPLRFSVTVVYAAPDVEALVVVTLSAGATVDDAIAQSGIVAHLALDPAQLEPAVFGQRVNGHTPLAPGDRIELTRALVADPKRARRKRAGDHPRPKSDARGKPRK